MNKSNTKYFRYSDYEKPIVLQFSTSSRQLGYRDSRVVERETCLGNINSAIIRVHMLCKLKLGIILKFNSNPQDQNIIFFLLQET